MPRALFSSAFAITSTLGICLAAADHIIPVQQQERSLMVEYRDGSRINHAVVFVGSVRVNRREESPPWTFGRAPVDERRCEWTVTPTIMRRTFVVLPGQGRAEKKDLTAVYSVPFTNQGSDWFVTVLTPDNCNDAKGRFDSDLNNAVAAVNRDMSSAMDKAYGDLIAAIKSEEGVVRARGN